MHIVIIHQFIESSCKSRPKTLEPISSAVRFRVSRALSLFIVTPVGPSMNRLLLLFFFTLPMSAHMKQFPIQIVKYWINRCTPGYDGIVLNVKEPFEASHCCLTTVLRFFKRAAVDGNKYYTAIFCYFCFISVRQYLFLLCVFFLFKYHFPFFVNHEKQLKAHTIY